MQCPGAIQSCFARHTPLGVDDLLEEIVCLLKPILRLVLVEILIELRECRYEDNSVHVIERMDPFAAPSKLGWTGVTLQGARRACHSAYKRAGGGGN